ncbi:MAG: FeoB-associated Cys-rich membrane protein [Tannerellaceae bacterium]|jgi:hypothetical protein|nr:FeoB-associated Cys-rich membrane protein [Tannerellaceae bacterium]
MWQEIALIITGILVLAYIGYKIRRFFTTKRTSNPCSGCKGCDLKN